MWPPDKRAGLPDTPAAVQSAHDTGNPVLAIDDISILAILANREIDNERFNKAEWRIEVYTNRNGRRYWNWRRRGKRGGDGNWRYGGKFDALSQERQAQYWQRAKSAAGSIADSGRPQHLPRGVQDTTGGGIASTGRQSASTDQRRAKSGNPDRERRV